MPKTVTLSAAQQLPFQLILDELATLNQRYQALQAAQRELVGVYGHSLLNPKLVQGVQGLFIVGEEMPPEEKPPEA